MTSKNQTCADEEIPAIMGGLRTMRAAQLVEDGRQWAAAALLLWGDSALEEVAAQAAAPDAEDKGLMVQLWMARQTAVDAWHGIKYGTNPYDDRRPPEDR